MWQSEAHFNRLNGDVLEIKGAPLTEEPNYRMIHTLCQLSKIGPAFETYYPEAFGILMC